MAEKDARGPGAARKPPALPALAATGMSDALDELVPSRKAAGPDRYGGDRPQDSAKMTRSQTQTPGKDTSDDLRKLCGTPLGHSGAARAVHCTRRDRPDSRTRRAEDGPDGGGSELRPRDGGELPDRSAGAPIGGQSPAAPREHQRIAR